MLRLAFNVASDTTPTCLSGIDIIVLCPLVSARKCEMCGLEGPSSVVFSLPGSSWVWVIMTGVIATVNVSIPGVALGFCLPATSCSGPVVVVVVSFLTVATSAFRPLCTTPMTFKAAPIL